jgi:hypothetical protein
MTNKKLMLLATGLLATQYAFAQENPKLDLHGDLRIREFFIQNRFGGAQEVKCFNSRVRISPSIKFSDTLELSARGVAELSERSNVDSRLKDGKEFYPDRAVLSIKPNDEINIVLGEQDNLFLPTIPVYDRDTPITGISASYSPTKGARLQAFYDAGRVFTDETNIKGFGLQATFDKAISDGLLLQGNAGYQNYNSDDGHRFSNSSDAKFNLVSAGGAVMFTRVPLVKNVRVFGEGIHNFDAKGNADAIIGGIKFGDANKPGNGEVSFTYSFLQKDSLPAGLVNRDTPRTNVENFALRGEFRLCKHFSVYGILGNPKHLIPTNAKDTQRQRYIELGGVIRF